MIESFRYHNTNCFFIKNKSQNNVLAVDAGWPCTFNEYKRNLKKVGLIFEDIKYAVVTHFHIDHAGLISEFQLAGVKCFVLDFQLSFIDEMERIIHKNDEYKEYKKIEKDKLAISTINDFNIFLESHGFNGYIESLNSHSEDHIGYFSDEDEAIIGDLAPFDQIMSNDQKANENWERILTKGIKVAYPSHADTICL